MKESVIKLGIYKLLKESFKLENYPKIYLRSYLVCQICFLKDDILKGGETMEERNDMKRSSALKKFIYSQLDRLKGQAETPNADLKIIEAKKNILEEVIKICENRGRY